MRRRTTRYAAALFIAWLAPMAAMAESSGTIGLTITLHAPAQRESLAWQSSSPVSLTGSKQAANALYEIEKELQQKYRPQQAAEMIDRLRKRMLVVSTTESAVESLRPIAIPVNGVTELRCERRTCESL